MGFPGGSDSKESACSEREHHMQHWIICIHVGFIKGCPGVSVVKILPAMQKTEVQPLGGEDPLEEDMATHSSILAWEILWTEEPCPIVRKVRVRHDWSDLVQYRLLNNRGNAYLILHSTLQHNVKHWINA